MQHVSGSLDLKVFGLSGLQSSFLTSELAGKTGDVFDFEETVGGTFVFKDILIRRAADRVGGIL